MIIPFCSIIQFAEYNASVLLAIHRSSPINVENATAVSAPELGTMKNKAVMLGGELSGSATDGTFSGRAVSLVVWQGLVLRRVVLFGRIFLFLCNNS